MNDVLRKEIREKLATAHGPRLRGILLFGSEARGTATAQSDIDILVLLTGPIHLYEDLHSSVHALSPVSRDCGRMISPQVAQEDDVRELRAPLYINAVREGQWI